LLELDGSERHHLGEGDAVFLLSLG
jgi:hypothetical protein